MFVQPQLRLMSANGVMAKAIVIYHTFSGNTKEVADLISKELEESCFEVESYEVGSGYIPELALYDICFLGTFTWEKGNIPEEMEDYLDYTELPRNKAIFGTGDTQFGGDKLFCYAVDRIISKYGTKYLPLRIEQSPRGSQEQKVCNWTQSIISLNRGVL